jgi:hypothetical protein
MRNWLVAIAAAATVLSAGSLLSTRADAMTLPAPSAVRGAIIDGSVVEEVPYICRRVWRCSRYGCGWRQRCYWTPDHRRYSPRRYYY